MLDLWKVLVHHLNSTVINLVSIPTISGELNLSLKAMSVCWECAVSVFSAQKHRPPSGIYFRRMAVKAHPFATTHK